MTLLHTRYMDLPRTARRMLVPLQSSLADPSSQVSQDHLQGCSIELASCTGCSHFPVWPTGSPVTSTHISAAPTISVKRYDSESPSTLDNWFTTSIKPISSTIEALPGSGPHTISGKSLEARNDSKLQTSTLTFTATPAAATNEKQPLDASRKWKTVALTLAAILGAIVVLGLVACLTCGWLVLDLIDRDQV